MYPHGYPHLSAQLLAQLVFVINVNFVDFKKSTGNQILCSALRIRCAAYLYCFLREQVVSRVNCMDLRLVAFMHVSQILYFCKNSLIGADLF